MPADRARAEIIEGRRNEPAGIKIMSFRFCHSRRCLRRVALRPGARDLSGDPRVLLELKEEYPIGQGKLSKKMPTGRYRILCFACMNVLHELYFLSIGRGRLCLEPKILVFFSKSRHGYFRFRIIIFYA